MAQIIKIILITIITGISIYGQTSPFPEFIPYKVDSLSKEIKTDINIRELGFEQKARWLSPDPLADKYPGWSPYNYCLNNPVNLVDPNGMWSSLPEFNVHWAITRWAVNGALSNKEMGYLHKYGQTADGKNYQKVQYSHRHAMLEPGKTLQEGTNKLNEFLFKQLENYINAQNLEKKIEELAYAMHAIQDLMCLAHFNHEWNGDLSPESYVGSGHIWEDINILNWSRINSSIEASRYLIDSFTKGKKIVIINLTNVNKSEVFDIVSEGKSRGFLVVVDGVVQ